MLVPVKGKKVMHSIETQDVSMLLGDTGYDFTERIQQNLEELTGSDHAGEEHKAFLDSISTTVITNRCSGIKTKFSCNNDLTLNNTIAVIYAYHTEQWLLVDEDDHQYDDYPGLADVQYFEGGFM